jgi:hypothetical protein
MKGIYLGRKKVSNETTLSFLSKEKNKKALDYLKKGYKIIEVSNSQNFISIRYQRLNDWD